jgi:hypothetical protein
MAVSTLNTVIKNHKEIERSYVQCGPFSKQKSLKYLLQEKLEPALAAWFKHACDRNSSIGGNHLKEKALHMAAYLGTSDFLASKSWINRFKRRHNMFTKLCDVGAGVFIQKLCKTRKITNYYKKLKVMTSKIYMLMRKVYFSIHNLANPSLFEEILAMVVQNLNSVLL